MSELKPCPLCSEHLWPCNEGFEHPASDTCPLDNMWFPERLVAAWNTRDTPTLSAEMELPGVQALADALRVALDYVEGCKVNNLPDLGVASRLPFMDDVLKLGDAALASLAAIKEPKT